MADQPPFYTIREIIIQERVFVYLVMNSEDRELNMRVIIGMYSEN
jgi:hypothetical protein